MFVTKKRFDQMMASGNDLIAQREKQAARDAETIGRLQRENTQLLAQLANWRANGQLRDPKTGRLIPKAKQGGEAVS
ncbi:hypothetical protein ACGGKE_03710 [Sphingobium naphthae]|uniref:hypothetical protein n=1 Tax=Sphingobium naphthae TaxID=1886786 RepID=UPI0037490AF7